MTPLLAVAYGGPGSGKSTTIAGVFAELKKRGISTELVHEVAKDFVWEGRATALAHQPYLTSKQMFHWDRLGDQVDVIVTDTSTLYALIYGKDLLPEFMKWIVADYHSRNTLNLYLMRNALRTYQQDGRYQNKEQAEACDHQILNMLDDCKVGFHVVKAATPDTVDKCVKLIEARL